MEPYATAAQPGPLNGNRPAVGGGISGFVSQYKSQIFWGTVLLVYTAVIWNVSSSMKSCKKKKKK